MTPPTPPAPLRIVLTGGSSGIGLGLIRRLTQDGHLLHVLNRRSLPEDAPPCVHHEADLADSPATLAAFHNAVAQLGGLDVLINNAGVMKFENAHDTTPDSLNSHLSVNLTAPILLSAAALQVMLAQPDGGHLLNIASVAGTKASPKLAVYSATKAALIQYTRSVAAEYAGRRIRANIICPGAISTGLSNRLMFALIQKGVPLGQLQSVEEIASLSAWLLSPQARNVTGSVYSLDGGMSL